MSLEIEQKFKQILTDNGYRITSARTETFKHLINEEPQSISELLKRTSSKVDRVSVYRSLELFEKLGIINRIYIGWKYKLELSDAFVHHHHHLSCLNCGAVIAIEDEEHINNFINKVASSAGFTPRRHTFEIDGFCASCSEE